MNNQRRKTIAKSLDAIHRASAMLVQVKDSEEQSLGQIPDDDEFDDKRDAIDSIIDNLDNIISNLDEAIDTLETTDF